MCAAVISVVISLLGQSLTPEKFHNTLGVTSVHKDVTPTQAFGVEFFGTFTLVLIVFALTDDHRKDVQGSAPLAIGLTVTAVVCAIVSLDFGHPTGS